MQFKPLGRSGLRISPLMFGGNVFGWTVDERTAFSLLDAWLDAGFNAIDTADVYSAWAPGNAGGESERIIGRWLRARGNRDDVVLASKVGMHSARPGLSAATIRRACDESLARLQADHIDLYYAHVDDPDVPLAETLGAFGELVRAGKVRFVAASNLTADRLAEALAVSEREGLVSYVAVQPHYNLVHRTEYEGDLASLCERAGLGVMPYYGLAEGFLTGKYRRGGPVVDSARRDDAVALMDDRGERVLAALDTVAASHNVRPGAVALAWLLTRPAVVAPIASARSVEQVAELAPMASLRLTDDDLALLASASRP